MTIIKNAISAVNADSIAKDLDIKVGDCLISINHAPVVDIFDFRTRTAVTSILIEIEKTTGELVLFDIEKDEYEDLGIEFEKPLMDESRNCLNKCVFCFIDQLPRGLRESLYFKDDDLRLSFLTGNYVTLTNLKDEELDRLVSYRLSPMNISVHTTNPALRIEMMKNKDAGKILDQLAKITQAGIWVNCQIVLCPGINDGEFLLQTLKDLFELGDCIKSIALVPVGLTRFRADNKVGNLLPFGQSSAVRIIEIVSNWQQIMKQSRGERIVFASDEFYIKAGMAFPGADEYDDFPQLENGVGMVPLFIKEMQQGLKKRLKKIQSSAVIKGPNTIKDAASILDNKNLSVLLITGVDANPYLEMFLSELSVVYDRKFVVKAIKNQFFGELITVAGLVTGGDIIAGISFEKSSELYEQAIIPRCMLRSGPAVFLDDLSISDVSKATGIPILCVDPTGEGLLRELDRLYKVKHRKKNNITI